MRRLIIGVFETICILMVVVPTGLGIATVIFGIHERQELPIILTLGVFLVTSFLAGGALTLVEIARNTRGCLEALRSPR